ncbi:MAG: 50S ribosomal protein L3, partial [Halobacteriales archaeon]|nr:50S ribosomal protein L3 [Halobacteriales archaeon]
MPDQHRPRKGSLGFGPRSRTSSEVPRFNAWPDDDGQPRLQAFAGYTAGMTHVVMVNDAGNSPREGMEESLPVTVVETPAMRSVALRAYEDTPYGARPLTEVWSDDLLPDLDRALSIPENHDADAAE